MLQHHQHDDPPSLLTGWSLLPHDLLLSIDNYLYPEDRYACLYVCRQWYSVFSTLFYTRVTVTSPYQCIQLCEHLAKVGDVIKELNIHLCTDDLEKWAHPLPSRCPSLRVLRVSTFTTPSFTISPTSSPHHNDEYTPYRNILGASIDRCWTLPSQSLTMLSLSIRQLEKDSVLRMTSQLPRLTYLYLNWINGSWNSSDMDKVHASCQQLTHVWISAETFITQANHVIQDDPEAHFEDDPFFSHASNDLIQQLFPKPAAGPAAPHLVDFHLSIYRGLSEHMCDWFVYAAHNYPNLEALALEMRPKHQDRVGERPFEYDLLDMLMTYKWTRTIWKQAALPALQLLFQSCMQLRSIHLFQLYLPRHFLEALFSSGLKIEAFGSTCNIHSIWRVDSSNWLFCSTLVTLSLQACITSPATNKSFMHFLTSMPCLRHLHLARYESFSLDALMNACPDLETLSLDGMPLLEKDQDTETSDDHNDVDTSIKVRLHTLVVQHAIISDKFFKHIRPGLMFLTMKHCAVIGSTLSYCAQMHIPAHVNLKSMTLDEMMFEQHSCDRKMVKVSGRLQRFTVIGLNATCTSFKYQWYDLRPDSLSCHQDERVLGIRPCNEDKCMIEEENDKSISSPDDNHTTFGLHIKCGDIDRVLVDGKRLLARPM